MAVQKIRETQINTATAAQITSLTFLNTNSVLRLPVGDSTNRPASPAFGTIRFNTARDSVEVYVTDSDGFGLDGWKDVGAKTSNSIGTGEIIRANPASISENLTIPAVGTDSKFASSWTKAPSYGITINNTFTVIVGANAEWTVF